ncbi:MAG: UbiA family prenyltransferase [Theionarchaea archaeon]|nr:UbiA family prenyltransferase [Theionarchaea archaeon]MBU7000078.1 UbiA family prenyltransferase [Theionarchaea archaeon]MBU7021708.1 UbiA family prenyltransferase [Theionarchaea archaeon]
MIGKAVALIRTMRPMTWVSVIVTVLAGMMIALQRIPPLQDIVFIAVLLPVFILGYANSLNAYTDYRIDEITRPDRAIPKGVLKKETVLYFSVFLFAGGLILSMLFLDLTRSLFVVAGLILATTYSIRPTRIKARGAAAPIAIAIGYVLIPLVGGFDVYSSLNSHIMIIATLLTVQTAGASISKDFIDLKGDDALDVDTIPLMVGTDVARAVVMCGLAVPVVGFPLLVGAGVFSPWFLFYLGLVPWMAYIFILMGKSNSYEKAYINCFFLCTASIFLSGIAFAGGIP